MDLRDIYLNRLESIKFVFALTENMLMKKQAP